MYIYNKMCIYIWIEVIVFILIFEIVFLLYEYVKNWIKLFKFGLLLINNLFILINWLFVVFFLKLLGILYFNK